MQFNTLKIGTYYVANILTDKENPKQLLMQGYFLGEEPQSSWEVVDFIRIGSLWNTSSVGPKTDFNADLLLGKLLKVCALVTWDDDEDGKTKFVVIWDVYHLERTKFDQELNVFFDELVKECIQDDESLANEITEDFESNEEDNNDI